jgi:hypothetical protein
MVRPRKASGFTTHLSILSFNRANYLKNNWRKGHDDMNLLAISFQTNYRCFVNKLAGTTSWIALYSSSVNGG